MKSLTIAASFAVGLLMVILISLAIEQHDAPKANNVENIIVQINSQRASDKLPPVTEVKLLDQYAQNDAFNIAVASVADQNAHVLDSFSTAAYPASEVGEIWMESDGPNGLNTENLAYESAAQFVPRMEQNPQYNQIIHDGQLTQIGIARSFLEEAPITFIIMVAPRTK
jgi:hypothetical protein